MMLINKNKFSALWHNPAPSYHCQLIDAYSLDVEQADILSFIQQMPAICQQYDIKNLLVVAQTMDLAVVPLYQTLIVETYAPLKLEKLGIVLPQDFTTRISIEQTLDEMGEVSYQICLFDNLEDAQIWITNPSK